MTGMQRPLRLPMTAIVLWRFVADIPGGSFAFVMATGIVSIAASLSGMRPVADLLFVVNLVAYPALSLLLILRSIYHPGAVLADLRDHRRGPGFLTIAIGTCVVGDQVSLITRHHAIAAALWIGGAVLWAGLSYCPFALTVKPSKPPLDTGLDGSWLLVVVAPEALAISAAQASGSIAAHEPLVFAGLCLFVLGTAFYVILITLILYRWLFRPMRPDRFAPSYWINMGAAAITVFAGARLLRVLDPDSVLAPLRGFVSGETVMFWALATWWIPLLCGLTVWRFRAGAAVPDDPFENWSIVFPLGMYTAATWHFSRVLGPAFLRVVPPVFVWFAILSWCLVFAGTVHRLGGWHRNPARVAPTRREGCG
jgi:tellurite resistance protein TehA-like permease